MMGIQPFAELIRRDAAPESRTLSAAEKILEAAKRAARLTTQLLRYTQPAEPAMDTIDLGHWVNEFRDEAQNLLWDRALAVSAEPSLLVRADSMQLQQIIANLVLNARDATTPGDVVTLGVARAHDIPFVAKSLANGTGFVTLFVQDSGKRDRAVGHGSYFRADVHDQAERHRSGVGGRTTDRDPARGKDPRGHDAGRRIDVPHRASARGVMIAACPHPPRGV